MTPTLLISRPTRPILIAFGFESNSGGQVLNTDATVDELAESSVTRILNPLTGLLENLHIGVNQNLGHSGLNPTTHGWHLQLNERMKAQTFTRPQLYIVEFGQGGSRADQWADGTGNRYTMIARYSAAIDKITDDTGQDPRVFMFNSWGINDAIAETPAASFKESYLELLDYINSLHEVEAYMVDIIFDLYPTYRTIIGEMADERDNIFLQDMQGKQQDDANHLGYEGMKDQTDEKVDKILELL